MEEGERQRRGRGHFVRAVREWAAAVPHCCQAARSARPAAACPVTARGVNITVPVRAGCVPRGSAAAELRGRRVGGRAEAGGVGGRASRRGWPSNDGAFRDQRSGGTPAWKGEPTRTYACVDVSRQPATMLYGRAPVREGWPAGRAPVRDAAEWMMQRADGRVAPRGHAAERRAVGGQKNRKSVRVRLLKKKQNGR